MIKPPCSREENFVRVDCERRCIGCRATCKEWAEYQKKVDAENERKKIESMLNDMQRERSIAIQKGHSTMKNYMRRIKRNG